MSRASYAKCEGRYEYVFNKIAPSDDLDHPVYQHRTADRYLFWNNGKWIIGAGSGIGNGMGFYSSKHYLLELKYYIATFEIKLFEMK